MLSFSFSLYLFIYILLYNTVLVLPYIDMNLPGMYMSSQSWTILPPPSPYHLSGSSECTSPKHPVSCTEPRLTIHFLHDIIHVSMPFSQIIPPSPSPTESQSLFYPSVSRLLSHIQGYRYHLSKFHIYVLVYCSEYSWRSTFSLYLWEHNTTWEQKMEMCFQRSPWLGVCLKILQVCSLFKKNFYFLYRLCFKTLKWLHICFYFILWGFFFFFCLQGMCDLSSPTTDRTHIERSSPLDPSGKTLEMHSLW